MPRIIPTNEIENILTTAQQLPETWALDEMASALKPPMPRRTLQRRLAYLIRAKQLIAEGKGRARVYRLASKTPKTLLGSEPKLEMSSRSDFPLSSEAQLIKQTIRQPVQARRPVGYEVSFLKVYRPNQSFYLSAQTRQHLAKLGQLYEKEVPAGTYARKIFNRLLIDLSWNSSRLEGNTYSLLETERLLELGEAAEDKDINEAQMILNHKAAIELLVESAEDIRFNAYTIFNLHALLSDNLLADPQAGGRLRSIAVGIGGTVYHPLEVPQAIQEAFANLLQKAAAISDPFEQAFFIMVHLPYLQPFEDVNKRVSRLAANIPLIRNNLCPLSFVDVPKQAYIEGMLGIYELNQIELFRDIFVWAYERSCARYSAVRQSLGEPDPFRFRHRLLIREIVSKIVRGNFDKKTAIAFIKSSVPASLTQEEQARYIEVIETELMCLHEGNIARYRLRPSEFREWQKAW